MKATFGVGLAFVLALVGCSQYASVAATSDGKALVAVNGLLGKAIYVCSVTPAGLTQCQTKESP